MPLILALTNLVFFVAWWMRHIFNLCNCSQAIWIKIAEISGKIICFPEGITVGIWLEKHQKDSSLYKASVIAAAIWIFCKGRCNKIFQNRRPNFDLIAWKAIDHVKEIKAAPLDQMGKHFYILNRPIAGTYGLYPAAFGSAEPSISGTGFYIIDSNFTILLASCCQVINNSNLDVNIKASSVVVLCVRMDNCNISRIYISSIDLTRVLAERTRLCSWISNGATS